MCSDNRIAYKVSNSGRMIYSFPCKVCHQLLTKSYIVKHLKKIHKFDESQIVKHKEQNKNQFKKLRKENAVPQKIIGDEEDAEKQDIDDLVSRVLNEQIDSDCQDAWEKYTEENRTFTIQDLTKEYLLYHVSPQSGYYDLKTGKHFSENTHATMRARLKTTAKQQKQLLEYIMSVPRYRLPKWFTISELVYSMYYFTQLDSNNIRGFNRTLQNKAGTLSFKLNKLSNLLKMVVNKFSLALSKKARLAARLAQRGLSRMITYFAARGKKKGKIGNWPTGQLCYLFTKTHCLIHSQRPTVLFIHRRPNLLSLGEIDRITAKAGESFLTHPAHEEQMSLLSDEGKFTNLMKTCTQNTFLGKKHRHKIGSHLALKLLFSIGFRASLITEVQKYCFRNVKNEKFTSETDSWQIVLSAGCWKAQENEDYTVCHINDKMRTMILKHCQLRDHVDGTSNPGSKFVFCGANGGQLMSTNLTAFLCRAFDRDCQIGKVNATAIRHYVD